ncbi:MAG TPA: uroporphyrinogen-III C-methyltransferase [Polyangia bacterium]|nr:uroporphyrinogen-III C-methyltransferase [Polyangia bacterium]
MVYLVGAGPGDPGLLTVRALELLRTAEVVAYDKLVPEAILALANPAAERLVVGRLRGEARRAFRLHPEVLARARAGRVVVRLKCGDPMVFGRGAEEAEDLVAAGIPFEIVPGVSAALGAAAYAGIPLTDRRCASSVTLTTGHDGHPTEAEADAPSSAPALPGRGTVVLYMGASNLADNLACLVAGGRAPATPAAYIERATERAQRVIVGTLADLAARVAGADPGPDGPAVVIVGEVVRLRPRTGWRERRPLSGRRVLVARARSGADAQIVKELRQLGATVDETPGLTPARAPDLVVLAGAAGASALVAGPLRALLANVAIIAMGAPAEQAARAAGAASVTASRHDSVPSLIAAVLSRLGPAPGPLPVPSPRSASLGTGGKADGGPRIAGADAHANADADAYGQIVTAPGRAR